MSCHHGVSTVNGSSWPSTVPSSSQATRVTTRSIGAIMPGADGACSTDNSCGPAGSPYRARRPVLVGPDRDSTDRHGLDAQLEVGRAKVPGSHMVCEASHERH